MSGLTGRPEADPVVGVELAVARLLFAGTLAGMLLIAAGIALMAANGISPTDGSFPSFDAALVLPDLVAIRPAGFLWAGILVLLATPIARVVAELLAFAVRRDARMAAVAAGILVVIATSVVAALVVEA